MRSLAPHNVQEVEDVQHLNGHCESRGGFGTGEKRGLEDIELTTSLCAKACHSQSSLTVPLCTFATHEADGAVGLTCQTSNGHNKE